MATERVLFEINEKGATQAAKNIEGIARASKVAHGSVNLLRNALSLIGVGLGLAEIIRTVSEFSGKMALLKATTDATNQELEEMRRNALRLGDSFGKSATEVATAMIQLKKAGIEGAAVLEQALQLMDIAGVGAAESATALTHVMNAYGLETEDAADTTDLLTTAFKNSTLSIQEIEAALGNVGPTARAAGVSMKDTLVILSSLSRGGANSRLVIGQLKEAFEALENPTDRDAAVLRTFGINVEKIKPSAVGVKAALEEMSRHGVEGLDQLKVSGGAAIDELLRRLPEISKLQDTFDESKGAGEKFAQVMEESIPQAIERLKNSITNLTIVFGDEKGFLRALRIAQDALTQIGATLSGVTNVIENYAKKRGTVSELFAQGIGEALQNKTVDAVLDKERADQEAKWKKSGEESGKLYTDGFAQGVAALPDFIKHKRATGGFPGDENVPVINMETGATTAPGGKTGAGGLGTNERNALVELRKPLEDYVNMQKRLSVVIAESQERQRALREQMKQGIGDQKALNEQLNLEVATRDAARIKLAQAVIETQTFQPALAVLAAKFEEIDTSVGALAAQFGDVLVGAIDKASNALAEFAITGFRNVEDLRSALSNLLKDIGREIIALIIKFLILKAIQAGLSAAGGGGGSLSAFVGAQLGESGAGAAGGKAAGGNVGMGEPTVVGERGPELFVPREAGTVVPAGKWEGGSAAPARVTIVNVTDKDQLLGSLQTPAGERAIMNVLNKNKRALQNLG